MITEEEKKEIIDLAVEKALLMVPEVVGNMMAQHALLNKVNTKFYNDYPEFKEYKGLVASVVELVEGTNPNKPYEELLSIAVPEIRKKISSIQSLDMVTSGKPDRDFSSLNGEL